MRTGVEQIHLFDLRDVALVLQEMIEKLHLDILSVKLARFLAEICCAKPVAGVARPATVIPWADDKHVEYSRILMFDRLVRMQRAI